MKKLLSVFMALLIISAVFVPALTASAAEAEFRTEVPTIHICGNGNWIFDKDNNVVWDGGVDVLPSLTPELPGIIGKLTLALATGAWDDYCDALVDAIAPVYSPVKLDNNGEATNGSYAPVYLNKTDWKPADNYLYSEFVFDFRLDPYENARRLHDYIQLVKAQTGEEKVNLESRCIGAELPIAYLELFGGGCDINGISLTAGANNGAYLFECFMSGRIHFDADSADDFVTMMNDPDEYGVALDLAQAFVAVANSVKALDLPIATVNMIFNKVKQNVLPRILLEGYATFPSYWGMISDEFYDDALRFIFGDENDEKRVTYAGLIEKIENYHNNAFKNQVKNISDFIDNGGKFVNIAKYNVNVIPVCEDNYRLCDIWFGTDEESFGATCSKTNSTLGNSYTVPASAVCKEPGHSHISPDNKVDASTCAFPEYTWFVRDSMHDNYGGDFETLIMRAFEFDGQMTVRDDPDFPQWLQETTPSHVIPMTAETESKNKSLIKTGFFQKIIRLFRLLIQFLKDSLNKEG